MIKWLAVIVAIAGAAGVGSKLWPDVARYLKIREM